MTEAWITIAALTLASAAIRASGPVLLGGRDLPDRFRAVIALIAPAVLAALVVVETFGAPEGGSLEIDSRLAGITAAAGALALGATMLPVVAVAATVTALLRAIS